MKKMMKALGAVALVATSATSFAAITAHTSGERAQVAQSDLVFKGRVSNVSYALAGEEGDDSRIPHTFVTYDVEQVLHGSVDSKQVVLRFIGGRGVEARFMFVSEQPMFDIGDRDVLMVAKNTVSGCPLVDCSSGRYRLIQGKVFSELGQALEQNAEGELEKVGYFDLPEVMTHKVSMTTMRRVDQLEEGESRVAYVEAGKGAHINEQQLVERLTGISRAVGKATPARFVNADPSAKIEVSFKAEAPAELSQSDASTSDALTDQEKAELLAVRSNGGNPVIGNFNNDAKDSVK